MKIPMPMKLTTVAAFVMFIVGVILASDIMVLGGTIILVLMSCTTEILEAIHDKD